MKIPMADARIHRSESGFALIEVDRQRRGAGDRRPRRAVRHRRRQQLLRPREGARRRRRSLAEQDQERLRAMSVDTLATVSQTPRTGQRSTAPTYKIESKADWVTDDAGGTPACGNSSKNNEYLHITTTVTSALVGTRTKPVKIDSLVAPSTQYSSDPRHARRQGRRPQRQGRGRRLDQRDEHRLGVPDGTTDANGCVIFKHVPSATYTITVNNGGYVATDLAPTVDRHAEGDARDGHVQDDRRTTSPTTARVTVKTHGPGGTSDDRCKDIQGGEVSVSNAKVDRTLKTSPAHRRPPARPAAVPVQGDRVRVLHRQLRLQEPRHATARELLRRPNPGSVLTDPASAQPQAVTVFQPPLNIRDQQQLRQTRSPTPEHEVYMTLQKPDGVDDTCTEPRCC